MKEKLQFYGDKDGVKNMYVTLYVEDIFEGLEKLKHLMSNGWRVRSAYHVFFTGKSIQVRIKKAKEMGYLWPLIQRSFFLQQKTRKNHEKLASG